MSEKIGVVLLNLGGPDSLDAVEPFLFNLFSDPDIIDFPFAKTIGAIPGIGPLYAQVIGGHNILVYAAAAAVPFTWWVIYRTRFGLRLRAAGENPHALDTAGVSVAAMRYLAMAMCVDLDLLVVGKKK